MKHFKHISMSAVSWSGSHSRGCQPWSHPQYWSENSKRGCVYLPRSDGDWTSVLRWSPGEDLVGGQNWEGECPRALGPPAESAITCTAEADHIPPSGAAATRRGAASLIVCRWTRRPKGTSLRAALGSWPLRLFDFKNKPGRYCWMFPWWFIYLPCFLCFPFFYPSCRGCVFFF